MKSCILLFIISVFPLVALHAKPLKPPLELYAGLPTLDNHPGHAPLISEVTYRAISDFVIDQSTQRFDPDAVKQGDIIYVNIWYLPWFEREVHDHIKYPYILISCDVGAWIPEPRAIKKLLYDPKLAAWFGRNFLFSYHPKLFQIAMGQNIYTFDAAFGAKSIHNLYKFSLQKPFQKQYLLYMNHHARAFGDRDKIVKLFENEPYCFSRNRSNTTFKHLTREAYYKELAASQFVISPLGLETDCLRNWEAWVLDCIPVVEHTFLDPLYEGLPIVFVHEWEEINEKLLREKYEQLKSLKRDKAYFDYWYKLIKDTQQKIRNNDLSSSQLEATQFSHQDLQDLLSILKSNGENHTLIYKGFLTTLRPLQIAKAAPFLSKIFLYDPWLTEDIVKTWKKYLTNISLLKKKNKLNFLSSETQFDRISTSKGDPIFLDLTYCRSSLLRDFNNLRHALKRDLQHLYQKLKSGTLLCGNMVHDSYVEEVLARFATESHVQIKTQGNFWFLIKS